MTITDFLDRLRKETTLSIESTREALFAIAERVNRKTHIMRLHWRAASITAQLDQLHKELGLTVANAFVQGARSPHPSEDNPEWLANAASQAQTLKQQQVKLDELIRELEVELLYEEMLKLQQDLSTRELHLRRLVIPPKSWGIGRTVHDLALDNPVRVLAVLRGPTVLTALEEISFRAGDIILLVGPRDRVQEVLFRLTDRDRVTA